MPHLPYDVDPCCGSRFDVHVEIDGTTRAYFCDECEELLADLIDGAEP